MESSCGCSSVIRILLRRSEAPSPCPQGVLRPLNMGKGKKGVVLHYVCEREEDLGGGLINQNPPAPAEGSVQESGQRKGKDVAFESGSEKIPVLLHSRSFLAQAPQAGTRVGLSSEDPRCWKFCVQRAGVWDGGEK